MSEDYAEYPRNIQHIPPDISSSGIKAIRRLQALPANRLHIFALLKIVNKWFLFCLSGTGIKMEKLS